MKNRRTMVLVLLRYAVNFKTFLRLGHFIGNDSRVFTQSSKAPICHVFYFQRKAQHDALITSQYLAIELELRTQIIPLVKRYIVSHAHCAG